jgi:ubiquitin carboxyl-terminal hydrolase 25/28
LADADSDRRQKSIEITRDMTQLRSRLHELRKEAVSLLTLNTRDRADNQPLSLPATFDHLHDALKSLQEDHADLEITPEFLNVLKDDKKEVEREIQETQDAIPALKASLESLWVDQRDYEYELVSVFMHRGKHLLYLNTQAYDQVKRVEQDITGHINLIYLIIVSFIQYQLVRG